MTSLPTVRSRARSDPGRGRTSQGPPASARGPARAGDPGGADNQDVGLRACEGTRGIKARSPVSWLEQLLGGGSREFSRGPGENRQPQVCVATTARGSRTTCPLLLRQVRVTRLLEVPCSGSPLTPPTFSPWNLPADVPLGPHGTGLRTAGRCLCSQVPGTHRTQATSVKSTLGAGLKLKESYRSKTRIWGTWEPQRENSFIFLMIATKKFPS